MDALLERRGIDGGGTAQSLSGLDAVGIGVEPVA